MFQAEAASETMKPSQMPELLCTISIASARPGAIAQKPMARSQTGACAPTCEFRAGPRPVAGSGLRARRRKAKCVVERIGSGARSGAYLEWLRFPDYLCFSAWCGLSSGNFASATENFRRGLPAERRTCPEGARAPADDLQKRSIQRLAATSIRLWHAPRSLNQRLPASRQSKSRS